MIMKCASFVSLFFLIATLLGCSAFGQDRQQWLGVESQDHAISMLFPSSDFVVDNEDDAFRIHYENAGLRISMTTASDKNAKLKYKRSISLAGVKSGYRVSESGDFLIQRSNGDEIDGERFYLWLYIVSSRGSYSISITSNNASNNLHSRVLNSILLDGKPLFTRGSAGETSTEKVSISSFKTDPAVLRALNQSDSVQTVLPVAPSGLDVPKDETIYSRSLIVLRKPKAAYSRKSVEGIVRLRVTFLPDGTLGQITLLRSLHKDLDKSAFDAAKKIKFLPAEIDGKPVEVSRIFEYGFDIY